MNPQDEKLLTIRELSERLRVSIASVYALIKSGKILALRVGIRSGAIRIRESEVAAYLESCVQVSAVRETVHRSPQTKLKHISLKPH